MSSLTWDVASNDQILQDLLTLCANSGGSALVVGTAVITELKNRGIYDSTKSILNGMGIALVDWVET